MLGECGPRVLRASVPRLSCVPDKGVRCAESLSKGVWALSVGESEDWTDTESRKGQRLQPSSGAAAACRRARLAKVECASRLALASLFVLLVNLRTQPRPPDLQSCKRSSPAAKTAHHPARLVQLPPARRESEHGRSTPTPTRRCLSRPFSPCIRATEAQVDHSTLYRNPRRSLCGTSESSAGHGLTMGQAPRVWRRPSSLGRERFRRVESLWTSIRGLQDENEGQPGYQAARHRRRRVENRGGIQAASTHRPDHMRI